jgi:hypothetical protein
MIKIRLMIRILDKSSHQKKQGKIPAVVQSSVASSKVGCIRINPWQSGCNSTWYHEKSNAIQRIIRPERGAAYMICGYVEISQFGLSFPTMWCLEIGATRGWAKTTSVFSFGWIRSDLFLSAKLLWRSW